MTVRFVWKGVEDLSTETPYIMHCLPEHKVIVLGGVIETVQNYSAFVQKSEHGNNFY